MSNSRSNRLKKALKKEIFLKAGLLLMLVWIAKLGSGPVQNGAMLGAVMAIGPLTILIGIPFLRPIRRFVVSDVGKLVYMVFATSMAYSVNSDSVTGMVGMAYAVAAKIVVLDTFTWFYGDDKLTMAEVERWFQQRMQATGLPKLIRKLRA